MPMGTGHQGEPVSGGRNDAEKGLFGTYQSDKWGIMRHRILLLAPLFVLAPVLFALRYTLDQPVPFLSSDGQIKYYQSVQYLSGPFAHDCLYPAADLDPEYRFFLFVEPWGYKNTAGYICVSQYPPFFSYLGTLAMLAFSDGAPMYVPLLLVLLNLLLARSLLSRLGVDATTAWIASAFLFLVSHVVLSTVDYSELSLFHMFLLLSFHGLVSTVQEAARNGLEDTGSSLKRILMAAVPTGLAAGASVYIRFESFILFGLLIGVLLFYFRTIRLVPVLVGGIAGLILAVLLFSAYNMVAFHSPFDVRALTFIDALRGTHRYVMVKARPRSDVPLGFLYQTPYKRGLFFAFPAFFLAWIFMLPRFARSQATAARLLLVAGWLFIPIAAAATPVHGGVGYFGLRYLDAGFLSFFLGLVVLVRQEIHHLTRRWRIIAMVAVALLTLPSILYSRHGIRQLVEASRLYAPIQTAFADLGPGGVIVHHSVVSGHMVGYSYTRQRHMLAYTNEEFVALDRLLWQKQVPTFLTVTSDDYQSPLVRREDGLDDRRQTNVTDKPVHYTRAATRSLLNLKLTRYEIKR